MTESRRDRDYWSEANEARREKEADDAFMEALKRDWELNPPPPQPLLTQAVALLGTCALGIFMIALGVALLFNPIWIVIILLFLILGALLG